MRRHSFLLMETLMASSLVVLVIGACLAIFVVLQKTSWSHAAALEKEGLQWRRTSTLRSILSRIQREEKDPFVLEDPDGAKQRLIFVFDHGVHIDRAMSNEDLAQLYVDPEKGLVLVTRSHPKRGVIGQEKEEASVLWPGAKRITWRFVLRKKGKDDKVGSNPGEKDAWNSSWPIEWPGLPVIIQATVQDQDGETIVTAIVSKDIGAITAK